MSDAFEFTGSFLTVNPPFRVAENVNVKEYYNHTIATDVYQCEDGLVGLTGLSAASDSYKEGCDEAIIVTACEYEALCKVDYQPKQEVSEATKTSSGGYIGALTYQNFAFKTSLGCPFEAWYLALGMTGEAGEVADKVKKVYRDKGGEFDDATREEIAHELGDCLWYLTNMATLMGYSIEDIARMNMEKITSRLKRGVLHGEGDYR